MCIMTEHEQKYAVRVTPSDKIRFRCTLCGACCRNVKETVPVSCQDAFYLTKHLRDLGMDIYCVDQFLEQYAEPALLDECGFFVYFLKSVGEDNACIFLKENRCSVQEAKGAETRNRDRICDWQGGLPPASLIWTGQNTRRLLSAPR